MNNMIARMCPKFKHYSGTPTLPTRIAVVVGICNAGMNHYYTSLFQHLSIILDIDDPILQYISTLSQERAQHKQKKITPEYKRHRIYGVDAKTKEEVH
jgi:hypothetical protein